MIEPVGAGKFDPKQWNEKEKSTELKYYAVHAALLTQATAFLTHITTTAGLYATVTGAAWTVVSANTFGADTVTLILLLALHIALSIGVGLGMWGVANNFIQRLNLARWLGECCWPRIEWMGGPEIAWRGVPTKEKGTTLLRLQKFEDSARWRWITWMTKPVFWFGYRAVTWPSLRHQRFWAILPALGAVGSIYLLNEIHKDESKRGALCHQAADALFPVDAPISREKMERALYVFDKASCNVTLIDPQRFRASGTQGQWLY